MVHFKIFTTHQTLVEILHTLGYKVLQAAKDLNAKRLFPVHFSKFALANYDWDEPLTKITTLNTSSDTPTPLITPIIGEKVEIQNLEQAFSSWWTELE